MPPEIVRLILVGEAMGLMVAIGKLKNKLLLRPGAMAYKIALARMEKRLDEIEQELQTL